MSSRIEVFEQMLESDPDNTLVLFGLAKEYEKEGRHADVVATLTKYLQLFNDEGNAYGMLAQAHERLGNRDAARTAYQRGIEVATAHGHPSMAEDYRMTLENEYED
ncbi:MAG TPA: tetratricopeptide repeat protein [Pyrinomonadaceae bacterium]|nr:tetratricopeptide repeat protein [Pyrinomonadaceae bacterium]